MRQDAHAERASCLLWVRCYALCRSVPFLLKPKNLGGMVGDIGFDPLGFSDYLDIKFLREAELKSESPARSSNSSYLDPRS